MKCLVLFAAYRHTKAVQLHRHSQNADNKVVYRVNIQTLTCPKNWDKLWHHLTLSGKQFHSANLRPTTANAWPARCIFVITSAKERRIKVVLGLSVRMQCNSESLLGTSIDDISGAVWFRKDEYVSVAIQSFCAFCTVLWTRACAETPLCSPGGGTIGGGLRALIAFGLLLYNAVIDFRTV